MRNALIRFGLLAIGLVYVAIGVVSARIAWLGARNRDEGVPGALRFLMEQRYGVVLLGAVILGVAGIAASHAVEAIRGGKGIVARVGLAANAIGYAVLVWTSARLLLHLGNRGASLEHEGISWLLRASWGATFLEIVGSAVIVGGLWEVYQGLRGRLDLSRKLLPRRLARGLELIARFGLVARGTVLCVLGFFLVRAAEELNPDRVRTLGGALSAFSHTALGPSFLGVVALGMAAYGVHLWTRALLKRKV
ncbi:MAG: DUF1206 domain-containing protein [Acidobacteriota bacterium]